MLEKRKIERFELNLPVKLVINDTVVDGLFTEDISSHGMFVLADIHLLAGTVIGAEVTMPAPGEGKENRKKKLTVKGKVVRSEKRGLAIQFFHGSKITH